MNNSRLTATIGLVATLSTACWHTVNAEHHYVGGDISLLPSYEAYQTPYLDRGGKKIADVIAYMKDTCGFNSMRVRLFVDPTEPGTSKTGVVQDLDYVTELGRRIKKAGNTFLLDIHYSDSWADPSNQSIPASWSKAPDASLPDTVYSYTKRCLEHLKAQGATPDFVQIGNEISYGMLWKSNQDKVFPAQGKSAYESQWKRLATLLDSGAKAVRESCPEARIIIHTERSGATEQTVNFYNYINGVDYDVIGLSYYPFYHNYLPQLSNTLTTLAKKFPDKKVQIVETAYFYQYFPTGDNGIINTTGQWPATQAGQTAFIDDLIAELDKHDNVNGLYYWFPEENGNGGATWDKDKIVITGWLNRGLWWDDSHWPLEALYHIGNYNTDGQQSTGLNELSTTVENVDNAIYNIAGQRVSSPVDGELYIQNGKKFIKR